MATDVIFFRSENKADINYRLESILRAYINTPSPNYAIMISSKWGSGKTTLIKDFLRNINPTQKKSVYVSLFGVASRNELEGEIMRALHPLLLSKAGRIVGKLAASALGYYKVDPKISLEDITTVFESDIFVFDDLERCEMSVPNALGYINQFVEHEGRHVIILCDERHFSDDQEYARRKEKIVGKTIGITAPTKQALASFISNQSDDFARVFLAEAQDSIEDVFDESECENLRVLKQTVAILSQLISIVDEKWRDKKEAMTYLCKLTVAVSIEIRLGQISRDDVKARSSHFGKTVMRHMNKDDKPKDFFELAQDKYSDIDLSDTLLSNDTLMDMIFDGYFDAETINNEIGKSARFAGYDMEHSWVTVWHFTERPESIVLMAVTDMLDRFERGEYKQRGVLLHVFGLLLTLSEAGQLDLTATQVLEKGKWYIDTYRTTLDSQPNLDRSILYDTSYAGLGFANDKTPEHRQFREYLDQVLTEEFDRSLPQEADRLMELMLKDLDVFDKTINHHAGGISRFASIPVLSYMPVSSFTANFLSLDASAQRNVLLNLHIRYDHNNLTRNLEREMEWVMSFREELLKETESMPKISAFRIRQVLGWTLDEITEIKNRLKSKDEQMDKEAQSTSS